MKVFLDCEFTSMSQWAKLISMALVAENGRELYLELTDTWRPEDCSEFVTSIVLSKLWGGVHAMTTDKARHAILTFLNSFEDTLEVVTDSPKHDWRYFEELISLDAWPAGLGHNPVDATQLEPCSEGADLPHNALLDARIIAGMFAGE